MTTETFYYCDYCGDKFDNKEDCIAHEKEHKDNLAKGIFFFHLGNDGGLRQLSKDADKIHSTLDTANLIFCRDSDSWNALTQIFEDTGFCPPNDYCRYESQFYAWDEAMNTWYDAGKRLVKLSSAWCAIKEIAGE